MKIRIGTRKSKLALIQSEMAAAAIKAAFPDIETELVHITTRGDIVLDKPLEKIGGKGPASVTFRIRPRLTLRKRLSEIMKGGEHNG